MITKKKPTDNNGKWLNAYTEIINKPSDLVTYDTNTGTVYRRRNKNAKVWTSINQNEVNKRRKK